MPPPDPAAAPAAAPAAIAVAAPAAPLPNRPTEILPHDPAVDRIVGFALMFAVVTACLFLLVASFAAVVIGFDSTPETAAAAAANTPVGSRLLSALGVRAGWAMTNLVRGAEVIATVIAALMVFLVIRARPTDALMSLLGLAVIAALIVPTNELLRIAESVRGQPAPEAEQPRTPYQPIAIDPESSQIVAQRVSRNCSGAASSTPVAAFPTSASPCRSFPTPWESCCTGSRSATSPRRSGSAATPGCCSS